MVDIFEKEICNYCQNTECKKGKLIEIKTDGVNIYKCADYKKDPYKIIPIEPPLPITAERDYIKYYER
jgi:hypothetical protein